MIFFFLFFYKFTLLSSQYLYTSCRTCKFEVSSVFSCHKLDSGSIFPLLWSIALYFSSDGEEMDGGKRLILMAQKSVKLTNGSLKLGKPLASRAGVKSSQDPLVSMSLSSKAQAHARPRHGSGCKARRVHLYSIIQRVGQSALTK